MLHNDRHDMLSFGDALFLYLERPGMPLHIASVSVFEGAVPLRACMQFVESKLRLIPRYRQRVVTPALNLGLPTWEYDPGFDIHKHVRQTTLKRGTDSEFKAAVATVLSANLDRSRPLWDLTLVQGLKGGCTGMVLRVHHCLADGLAGIGMMNALLDPSPVSRPLPRRVRMAPAPAAIAKSELVDSILTAWSSAVQQVLTAHSELLSLAEHFVGAGKRSAAPQSKNKTEKVSLLEQWTRHFPEVAAPAERLPFNVVCRGPQKFRWTEIPVAEIKAVKQAAGATFNDVALAAIALAVRGYSEAHGVRVKNRMVRIVVPVSVRGNEDAKELGNRITFIPVSIPLGIGDARRVLNMVRERMAGLKSTHVAELVGLAGTLIGAIPSPLQALLGPIASQLPLSVCNLIFTNVRGPEGPLYLLGHKMLSCYPYVPIGGEMGMNCAMLTYNGTAYFGFTGDANAIPDLSRFEGLLTWNFAELRKRVGIPAKRAKAPHLQAKPAPKPAEKLIAEPAVAPTASQPAPEPPALPPPQSKAAAA